MPSRRPAPTMLLTAIAATVVILPWALDGGAEDRPAPASAADTRLAEQALPDLGGGVSVRELSQDTPFSLIALTGTDLAGTSARVRARDEHGGWGPWFEVEAPEFAGDDAAAERRGTEPVFVGRTHTVQIEVTRPAGAPTTTGEQTESADTGLGYRPAATEESLGQNVSAVLISPPQAPVDAQWNPPNAVTPPGQPPAIIGRAQWGADETTRCPADYGDRIRAAVVHHTAGSNDYSPQDSPAIVQAIQAYHTRTLGWCDIAYNALVDRYGQVFEGRAGGINRAVRGSHTGGFNTGTWGVAMLGNFDDEPPTAVQARTVARLLGWRLSLDGVDPLGTATLRSAGGAYTSVVRDTVTTLPAIFTHRDVGATDCPGHQAYAMLDWIRTAAARFNRPPGPEDLIDALQGGAILARWQAMGGMDSVLGAPTSPESAGADATRYATFSHGAMYWSPQTGAQPLTGAIYDAWAALGYERGVLGLPTSGEIQEPQWIGQNFQHGTLNFDRLTGNVTRVVDGMAQVLPPPTAGGPPVQLERFSPPVSPAD
ncbi:N-acetylmuramoyl-L-alanine amidase [Mycolicibacillus trivialis]|uniref:Cold-shock protein n=1 Tax=Mycolicibacillus trivialis TaxID=1798 RepID=A0A1X2EMJ8_9MYCO|nr:N-acetylmuramoyl-L-alanine amidase [Mycolicibacillus trivialis]ORX06663.1 cold-shock protein [Mycolicibacillus trivialis]